MEQVTQSSSCENVLGFGKECKYLRFESWLGLNEWTSQSRVI